MSSPSLIIDAAQLNSLQRNPRSAISGQIGGVSFTARIAIPNYGENIRNFYGKGGALDIQSIAQQAQVDVPFAHFGLIIAFASPIEIHLHDESLQLDEDIKNMVAQFGAVIIRNAYLHADRRKEGHRNRFPHLNFHIDRSPNQPNPYSLFSRDPFCPEQVEPRTSSSLFIPNLVAYLQCVKEGQTSLLDNKTYLSHCDIFGQEDMKDILGNIALEQSWTEPSGTGELTILDNRTVLHASYYRDASKKGYRIGVRYVG